MIINTKQNKAIKYKNNETLKLKTINSRANEVLKAVKQGIVTDTFINSRKDENSFFLDTSLPKDLKNTKNTKTKNTTKSLLSMISVSLGVLGAGTLITGVLANIYKKKLNPEIIKKSASKGIISKILKPLRNLFINTEKGPPLGMNINIKTENQFATYEALRDPSLKKILGAMAVFTLSSAIFAMKNTVDGFKEIWVKKKNADIQRNFQEKMIDIETSSFAGKKQIVRYLLNKKENKLTGINKSKNISFKGNLQKHKKSNDTGLNLSHLFIGIGAAVASVFLIGKSIKNIRKISKTIENTIKKEKEIFAKTLKNTTEKQFTNKESQFSAKKVAWELSRRNFSNKEASEILKKTGFTQKNRITIRQQVEKNNSIYANADPIYGVPGKATLYTYLDDLPGHLYNMIVNPSKFTASLFAGLSAVTGLGYVGSKFVEANKEVEVKKAAAEINLDMQDKLVKVELKNFKKKKEAAVNPLIKDYSAYADKYAQNTKGIKSRYNSIINEIKNGPPFIYD